MPKSKISLIRLMDFLIIAIPLAVTCYFFIYANVQSHRKAEIDKNIMIARSAGMVVEQKIDSIIADLQIMAGTNPFMGLEREAIKRVLLVHKNKFNIDYFVNDANYNILVKTHQGEPTEVLNLKNNTVYNEALRGKTVVSGQRKSALSGVFAITLAVPIRDDTGKVVGVLGTHLPTKYFKEFIAPIKVGKNGFLSLVDKDGFYIYDREIDNSAKLVSSRCYQDNPGADLSVVERKSTRDNQMKLFVKVKLKELGWYIIAHQPSSDLTAPAMSLIPKNIITLVLLALVVFLLWRYRVVLEQRRLLMQTQNTEKLALVGELAAGMAHEIRNPLTTIKGFSDLLKNKPEYVQDREVLEMMSLSVDHIEGIVRETLLLSKPQKMTWKNVDLGALIKETGMFMLNEALLREIKLCFDAGGYEKKPLCIKGDPQHLRQVLINLIKNSLEATAKGGFVTIIAEKDVDQVRIKVEDNGCGISADALEKVGTPFYTTKEEGTGLGLSVCKRIIEDHQGLLDIKSLPGKGTTVEITLPLSNDPISDDPKACPDQIDGGSQ